VTFPVFSHFSYNSFELERRDDSIGLHLSSSSCTASVSAFPSLSCFYWLETASTSYNNCVSTDAAKTLVHALISCCVDYCNSILYGACAAHLRPLQSVLNGAATHRRKAQVRPHHRHHVSRPSLAAGETTHSVQAGHDGVQVPSSHGAVVPSRHVHSCVVYNWSSTSPFPSRSDNSTQSIGAIRITQLRHFRPFNLELIATDCS